jgi:hypothetical protein
MPCEMMKCGHCKSLEVDDQCGRPEHRYCIFCSIKESSDETEAWAGNMYDAIEEALKDSRLPAELAEILKKATKS